MKVMLTGSNGFVGRAVAAALEGSGCLVVPVVRRSVAGGQVAIDNLDGHTDWAEALRGCEVVVHLAARAHVMQEEAADPLAVYSNINTAGTLNLASQAAKSGVRRFVFTSSIKVNGERTVTGSAFKVDDLPQPEDAYAVSKHEAEIGLRQIANETGMEVVIIRSPLVYGPGVKGNFSSMMRWLQRGLPMPLGAATRNFRSLVALDNLVDLITTCINHPLAANKTFLVSDGEDLSTADLLRRLGQAMGKPARLLPVPPALVFACAKLLGRGDMAQRLFGNLQVDISYTCQTLGWKPPISVDEGLRRAVREVR
ncbi:SDR family oxidoreductase [Azonexus fungiphilus]|nr:SDR family oxidoreductase [Azonexus fungiphilus]